MMWTLVFAGTIPGIGGCVVPKTVGDGETDPGGSGSESGSESETGTETESSSETSTDDGAESSSTGAPAICEDNPLFQCSAPYDCSGFPCGGINDWFDADGCMRQACGGDEDCDAGEVCFRPIDFGGCASSGIDCWEEPDGSCSCGADADCNGSFCLPEGEVPM